MTGPKHIDTIWAWVATESDGGHGIPAIELDGTAMPLIGSDLERMESLRGFAMSCLGTCSCVELVAFTGREVLEAHYAPPPPEPG